VKLVLDTHIWLWVLLEPNRIPEPTKALLGDPNSELHLASVSLWEALTLTSKGRISVTGDPLAWIKTQLRASPVRVLPLSSDIIISAHALMFDHKDPADRWIVATAQSIGASLVTADRVLQKCGLVEVVFK
jgi:PIN domain nuclease of toxin-antitoxin system